MIARALALLAAAAAAPALAQPAPGAGRPASATAPDADRARRSGEDLARMRAAVKAVTERAEAARSEKDVVKLNCLNERLTQMRAFLRMAEQAEAARAEAAARKVPAADGDLSRVGVARAKVDALRAEAERCEGQVAYAVEDRTTVQTQPPEGLAQPGVEWNQDARPDPATPPVVRPSPASLFQ
ncbi:MAG TPA: hypothetical protein VLS93_05180 [Anaeromyxobacteraceae bacterium]|nr:hypothetical protein [Anaeromyxobacteraceae bacterium]